ncbi:hypothetical protein EVAR_51427_1 [Eumeta japonica]|uniref:Uncharacterized protein n=1 Tax=Eumeta variegata TaxID=151549 RepID=A0A4C1XTQ7_EUMVA|nr:hypothetical protein EVAR_51427_1 [Eumeta japonica]
MPRITALVYAPSRACVKLDFEVHEIFTETAESLNVWAVNFNAVVGGADGFTSLSADGYSPRIFEEVSAFAQENGWSQFRPRRCGGLGTRPRSGFGGHRLRGSGDWIWG